MNPRLMPAALAILCCIEPAAESPDAGASPTWPVSLLFAWVAGPAEREWPCKIGIATPRLPCAEAAPASMWRCATAPPAGGLALCRCSKCKLLYLTYPSNARSIFLDRAGGGQVASVRRHPGIFSFRLEELPWICRDGCYRQVIQVFVQEVEIGEPTR